MVNYHVVHNPPSFETISLIGKATTVFDLIAWLSDKNKEKLNKNNFMEFLNRDLSKQRQGMAETMGFENHASIYIAKQIARKDKHSEIILTDGRKRKLSDAIKKQKPKAVWITCLSSNFASAVADAIVLNHGKIPVIIGGIHVSVSPEDVDTYIRNQVPYPKLISIVQGPADSDVIKKIILDLNKNKLKKSYVGLRTIENGVWKQTKNISFIEKRNPKIFKKLPIIGSWLSKNIIINSAVPYSGCPYNCSFCSISGLLRSQRKFIMRTPKDFVEELESYQKNKPNLKNRYFLFLPDNLLLGGKKLEEILDLIIKSNLKINWTAQVSINVAENEKLLKKMRAAGCSQLFIGFESLDIRNLKFVNKNIVRNIEKSRLNVKDYYSNLIKKIQNQGIGIVASFIIGLPYDKFISLNNHTGKDIADFCIKHKIILQPSSYTYLPGSQDFKKAQKNKTFIYGRKGSIEYLLSLSSADLTETNKTSQGLSPLVVSYMAYDSAEKTGTLKNIIKIALHISKKSFQYPTQRAKTSFKERVHDSFFGFFSQLFGFQYYYQMKAAAYPKKDIDGFFERFYEIEKNKKTKKIFKNYTERFKRFSFLLKA